MRVDLFGNQIKQGSCVVFYHNLNSGMAVGEVYTVPFDDISPFTIIYKSYFYYKKNEEVIVVTNTNNLPDNVVIM